MDFIAIDVETANSDMSSICQIGLAIFSDGQMVDEWVSLVNPEDYFHPINVGIHGINELDVQNAPTFHEISEQLVNFFANTIIVSHTHFDRLSINRAFSKYLINIPEISWIDSSNVARRTWPEFSQKGYGLKNLANHIGYSFKHHDALEDAKAAGHVLLEAIKVSNLDLSEWQTRLAKPIKRNNSSISSNIKRDGNPEGQLYSEVIVFTGTLKMPRNVAADLAAKLGCKVSSSVTKKTTILVVGDQDISKLSGKEISSKHLKAVNLICNGQNIRIIKESDFEALVKCMD